MVDSAVANITELLRAKKMYQNSLLIFSSDNGGKKNKYHTKTGHSNGIVVQ